MKKPLVRLKFKLSVMVKESQLAQTSIKAYSKSQEIIF